VTSEPCARTTTEWIDRAATAKGSTTIAVVVPCRNEAGTVGPIVAAVVEQLVERHRLVDELVVVDDHSTDQSAHVAREAGATVVDIGDLHDRLGPGAGKGDVLWCSLSAIHSDVVVWCDADLTTFDPAWIAALSLPILTDPSVHVVKPVFRRPTDEGGGGRTTELVARPLLSLLAPELAHLDQPLAGETAVRRRVVEQLPFAQGWGVEIALLLDVAERHGTRAIAEVPLGTRRHRHRSLDELALQAAEVLATVLARRSAAVIAGGAELRGPADRRRLLRLAERPPLRHAAPC
jgi:glucosyl-3-phosphoglycerate synthase